MISNWRRQVTETTKTTVVHVTKSRYDVYIGRGQDPRRLLTSEDEDNDVDGKWGNPFRIGRDGTRQECIQKYREWIVNQPELMAALPELQGMRLGCWCRPGLCHGDILAELADKTVDDKVDKNKEETIFGKETP